MGINLRFFKIRFIFHAGLFRPIVGSRRRALYVRNGLSLILEEQQEVPPHQNANLPTTVPALTS